MPFKYLSIALKGSTRSEIGMTSNKLRGLTPEAIEKAKISGDAIKETLTKLDNIKGISGILDNLREVPAGEWSYSAIGGALGWGAYGGVSEWSQGGSFWEGAKSGAFSGAFMGTGYRAFKSAPFGTYQKGRTAKESVEAWGGVSKQVQAMSRAQTWVDKANRVMNR